MTPPNVTSSTDSQMHNNIMAAGPYKPTTVLVHAVDATDDSPAVHEHTTVETPTNMSPKNKDHFLAEKEAINLILIGIVDDIYLTVNACKTAQEMWEAIERLQQGQRSISLTTLAEMVKLYKPTNNNLGTSLNFKNKNVDTTPWYKNDDHSGQFGNQRTKAKKSEGLRVPQGEDVAELEAHYSYMAKIQEVPTADSGTDSEPVGQVQNNAKYNVFSNELQHFEQSKSVSNTSLVETDDSNVTPDSSDMCEDDIQNEQNNVESDDERVALANLKLYVDENKKIQKQLKKANTTFAQELKECKTILTKTNSCMVALQTKQAEFEKYKAFNDRTIDYEKLERKLNEALGQLAHKDTFGSQRTVNVAGARENVGSPIVQQTGIQCFNCKDLVILLRNVICSFSSLK
nr:hypothetical protein [Tanacetum cinerariifolium]